jgi:hypothetical protein
MVETLTPAGCGGPARHRLALVAFAAGAVAAAAALGATLGAIGGTIPRQAAFAALAIVALLGAAREAGLVRFPIPESRRQVPEHWRRRLPLPVWSAGYGALLGAGVGTFQPVITFWVACAGALALGSVTAAAVCLALFGAGRALMVALPAGDPLARLAGMHRFLRPANAALLATLAILMLPTAASAAPAGQSDPTVAGPVIAYTDQANGVTNVVVLEPGRDPIVFPDARMPSLSGDALAYVDPQGIRVVLWRSGLQVLRISGPVDTPALSGPRIAYVRRAGARRQLVVRNFSTGATRVIVTVRPAVDLGRPALSGQLVAWHQAAGDDNRILLHSLASRRTLVVATGRRSGLLANPAIAAGHVAWIESRAERSSLMIRRIPNGRVRRIAQAQGPVHHLWNTALAPGFAWVTRWSLTTASARILRYRW